MDVTYALLSGSSDLTDSLEMGFTQLTREEIVRVTFGASTNDRPLIDMFSYEVSSTIDESYIIVSYRYVDIRGNYTDWEIFEIEQTGVQTVQRKNILTRTHSMDIRIQMYRNSTYKVSPKFGNLFFRYWPKGYSDILAKNGEEVELKDSIENSETFFQPKEEDIASRLEYSSTRDWVLGDSLTDNKYVMSGWVPSDGGQIMLVDYEAGAVQTGSFSL